MIKDRLGHELSDDKEIILTTGARIKFLPPVSEGDVSRLISLRPKIIGIIDGYFENMPSIWHKEILYAMSEGIHVLGASSMGALRAAELEVFGMEGIGAVFRAFSDGFLEDDDEVTVAHGPADLGFPLLSEAMVNIRRTLDDACQQGALSSSDRDDLTLIAKQLNYKRRNYGKIIAVAREQAKDEQALNKFHEWLKEGRTDQKLLDALLLLKTVIERLQAPHEPKRVLYNFERTAIWEGVRTKHAGNL
jgi:hypothetical protein